MALSFILAILLLQLCRHASALVVTPIRPEQPMVSSRRGFFHSSAAFTLNPLVLVVATVPANSYASDASSSLINELVESKAKLKPIPGLLEQQEWEQVRQILKKPPVNKLWNLGDSQNTLLKLARDIGDPDMFELKDELAISLQMCDQLTYDNAFVYFQPGNGKVKIKEPTELANKAMEQIQQAIELANQ